MPKPLKYILLTLLSVPVILIACLVIILSILDPNEYRQDIEELAHQHAGLTLQIKGPLNWSYWPLALEVGALEMSDQNDQPFASLDRLLLNVDTLSLLKMQPNIAALSIEGLVVDANRNAQGDANWEKLITKTVMDNAAPPPEPRDSQTTTAPNKSKALEFRIQQIDLLNTRLSYEDAGSHQTFQLNDLSLRLSEIAPGEFFPMVLKTRLGNPTNKLNSEIEIRATMRFSPDFNQLDLRSLAINGWLESPKLGSSRLPFQLVSEMSLDLAGETFTVPQLTVDLDDLTLKSSLNGQSVLSSPLVSAKLAINALKLRAWLERRNIHLRAMQNPNALGKASMETEIRYDSEEVRINKLTLNLDDSQFTGELQFDLDNQALALDLRGDQINIDHYLPPQTDDLAEQPDNSPAEEEADSGHTPLLPLDTLRTLNLDIKLQQDALIIKNTQLDTTQIALKAGDGQLSMPIKTRIFSGALDALFTLDARPDNPDWDWKLNADTLALPETFLTEVLDYELGARGTLNLSHNGHSSGNTATDLQDNLTAKARIAIEDGAITGVNLNHLACKGFALINNESIQKNDWTDVTQFQALSTSLNVRASELEIESLDIGNLGLKAEGSGKLGIDDHHIDARISIRAVGELGDQACRVHEKVQDLSIPVRCQGKLTDDPVKLCQLDSRALAKTATELAKREAQRKAEKEIDRAVDKKLEKYLGEDNALNDSIKKGTKKLFESLLK